MAELSEEDLIDAAELGEKAKEFLDSDVGKSLLMAAEADAQEALEQLAHINPSDIAKIMECQIEIKASRKFNEKLQQLVTIGNNALEAWRQTRTQNES